MTSKELKIKNCLNCYCDFRPKRQWQVFCNKKCKNTYWTKKRQEAMKLLEKEEQVNAQ